MDDNDSPPEIRLTNEEAVNVCRLEQKEKCCAFLTFDAKGFSCIKNTNLCDVILDRIKNGKMYLKGEGGWEGCLWKKQCDNITVSGIVENPPQQPQEVPQYVVEYTSFYKEKVFEAKE